MRSGCDWRKCAIVMLAMLTGCAADQETGEPAAEGAVSPWLTAEPVVQEEQAWPGIAVNREAGHIDLTGEISSPDGQWLELLACIPNTREYESLVTVRARPSHIHLALLTLGASAGEPMTWRTVEGQLRVTEPHGSPVEIFLVLPQNGDTIEVPANRVLVNQDTNRPMEQNRWLFTGSRTVPYEDKRVYLADIEGSVVSIVHFGDDVLARPTGQTNKSDGGQWNAAKDQLPARGTPVLVRLRPVN